VGKRRALQTIRIVLIGTGLSVALVSEGLAATESPRRPALQDVPGWLDYVNSIRAETGLPSLTEEVSWSEGIRKHAIYIVKTGEFTHYENPDSPWYTPEGDQAARSSNLGGGQNDKEAIDGWMQAPFHAVGILDPRLARTGFGTYPPASGHGVVAGIDVIRGLGEMPASISFPIEWPADGSTTALSHHGGEWPSPLTACAGYSSPAGLPLIVQMESPPAIEGHSFRQGDEPLRHCVFDGSTYTNSVRSEQDLARSILAGRNAVVLIPKEPLLPGRTYTASITSAGVETTWSFTVSSSAPNLTIGTDGGKRRCRNLPVKKRRKCRRRQRGGSNSMAELPSWSVRR
jgi:hypothetical protein